ncbi:hypothetical protein DMUE_1193 [Dictyocoela muelleri]|nr:hypothetical protein DMUE_1193 [Dictyocoela muelleri]
MVEVISNNVLPGSIVIPDQWLAYQSAFNILNNNEHNTFNQLTNFVDPMTPEIHTQNIGELWSRFIFLRNKTGINKEQHLEYIIQFIWEYKIEKRKRLNR